MKRIQNGTAMFFIFSVFFLSVVSIFGVWDLIQGDVVTKSFETLGLLSVVALVVMIAAKHLGSKEIQDPNMPAVPDPIFRSIRKTTLVFLIMSISVLVLLGILAIWDVIKDANLLNKS
ncbi:MAG: hypothetical protein ACREGC_03630, partial [Minisyncoccia bacterium]